MLEFDVSRACDRGIINPRTAYEKSRRVDSR